MSGVDNALNRRRKRGLTVDSVSTAVEQTVNLTVQYSGLTDDELLANVNLATCGTATSCTVTKISDTSLQLLRVLSSSQSLVAPTIDGSLLSPQIASLTVDNTDISVALVCAARDNFAWLLHYARL